MDFDYFFRGWILTIFLLPENCWTMASISVLHTDGIFERVHTELALIDLRSLFATCQKLRSDVLSLISTWPTAVQEHFWSSFVNVILTRQTCGQRSSRTWESKRRALGNYFSERICYMLQISKCRGYRDLGLCTTSGLALGKPKHNAKF